MFVKDVIKTKILKELVEVTYTDSKGNQLCELDKIIKYTKNKYEKYQAIHDKQYIKMIVDTNTNFSIIALINDLQNPLVLKTILLYLIGLELKDSE